jgi:anti-sigma B factor antagonist
MSLKIRSKETAVESFDVFVEGRLDSATFKQLETFLDGIIRPSIKGLRFDLSGLEYLSSMGLRVFLKTSKTLKAHGAKMAMINLQPQIKKVFEIANALGPMTVFESVEEADRYFDIMQKQEIEKQKT